MLECENAVALREAGITQPILLLEGIFSARRACRRRTSPDDGRPLPEQLECWCATGSFRRRSRFA
jgi:hypothetical protein